MRLLSSTLIVFILLTSCEDLLFEEDLASTDAQVNFDYLWNECHKKYSYFELKGVDWYKVKLDHQALLYPGITPDSLFNVMGSMLRALKDDHANLISNFNISSFGTAYLGADNFDWRIIVDSYISQDYYRSGALIHDFLLGEEIAYVRLPSFRNTISEDQLDFVLNRYRDTKGLILDLRENGGGSIANTFILLRRFVDQETLVNYSTIKTGPGPNDFSKPKPVFLRPYDGMRYLKKVIVLTDRGTYSSGSLTALAAKALPNMIILGDTTGGGLGMPNGGQLPNGWTYRFSITQALTLDHKPDYENGVPPDLLVQLDWNDLKKDEILERAILELR